MRTRDKVTAGSMPSIAAMAAASASAGARSISTSMLRFIKREAASRTSTATNSAAAESARGYPARTRISPNSTATEPKRSLPKCSALAPSAALWYSREARQLTSVRLRSIAITMPMTANAYQVASTDVSLLPTRCVIARHAMKLLARTRIEASASALRCSAFPCPYWRETSAGRTATPTAKNVSSAAIRSVPECAASETRPRLCEARPAPSFSAISATAAAIEIRAVRRCGCTRQVKQKGPLQRPLFANLRVGYVARELLADAVRPLVLPVVEMQGSRRGGVLEVELAARVALQAREGPAGEDRCDERRRIADARGVAGRIRVERSAGDGSGQVAAELAVHARDEQLAVLSGGIARTWALPGERHECALVPARHPEGAVGVGLDAPRALARVGRPRVAAGAVIRHGDQRREACVVPVLFP